MIPSTLVRFVQWPWALVLVLVLPALTVLAVRAERRSRARRLAKLGTRAMLARLAPIGARLGRWRTVRLTTAVALCAIAFAGPRWGIGRTVARGTGVDVVLALDASLSMMAQDAPPSRLENVKNVVRQLRALSPGDRFALLAFAGRSYILSPLTSDDGALELYLDNLDPSTVGTAGTTLATAIRQGTTLLTLGKDRADRALILMSDGEGFEPESDLAAAAQRAADAGIALITVGFGTTQGTTIPIRDANGRPTLKRDQNGQIVVTRYSPALLSLAARTAKGVFIPADAPNKAERIRHVLDGLKTETRTMMTGDELALQFQWFVIPAMLLLLLDTFLALRPRRRVVPNAGAVVTSVAAVILAVVVSGCGHHAPPSDTANVARYNRGTTLLGRDSLAAALPPLDSAITSSDTMVHFRAAFNSGWAHLVTALRLKQRARGAAGGGSRGGAPGAGADSTDSLTTALDSTLAKYRIALIANPADSDAKWNYELALTEKQKGGGGGGGSKHNPSGGASRKPGPSTAIFKIEAQQAEAILNSAQEQEQKAAKPTPGIPQPPPQGKDW